MLYKCKYLLLSTPLLSVSIGTRNKIDETLAKIIDS